MIASFLVGENKKGLLREWKMHYPQMIKLFADSAGRTVPWILFLTSYVWAFSFWPRIARLSGWKGIMET